MPRDRLAASVILTVLAILPAAVRAEDNAADVQGKWERNDANGGRPVRLVKEHKGNRTTLTVFDENGAVLVAHKSEFEVRVMGEVKLFVYSNMEITAGPNKGQKAAGPFAYIYRVGDGSFYEVTGLLKNETAPPEIRVWTRVKE
jgi:hypothetical protein